MNGRKKGGRANTGAVVEDSSTPLSQLRSVEASSLPEAGGAPQRCNPARARLAVVVVVQLQTGKELRLLHYPACLSAKLSVWRKGVELRRKVGLHR